MTIPPSAPPVLAEEPAEKCWIVIASGHGSNERPDCPPALLTRSEAEVEADRWVGIADTIGGTASVVHVAEYVSLLYAQARQGREDAERLREAAGLLVKQAWDHRCGGNHIGEDRMGAVIAVRVEDFCVLLTACGMDTDEYLASRAARRDGAR